MLEASHPPSPSNVGVAEPETTFPSCSSPCASPTFCGWSPRPEVYTPSCTFFPQSCIQGQGHTPAQTHAFDLCTMSWSTDWACMSGMVAFQVDFSSTTDGSGYSLDESTDSCSATDVSPESVCGANAVRLSLSQALGMEPKAAVVHPKRTKRWCDEVDDSDEDSTTISDLTCDVEGRSPLLPDTSRSVELPGHPRSNQRSNQRRSGNRQPIGSTPISATSTSQDSRRPRWRRRSSAWWHCH
jgi:hypothetical protein